MPVPKKKRSKSKSRIKKAAWSIEVPTLRACSSCGALTYPHRVCTTCGYYKGVPQVAIKQKKVAPPAEEE